MPYSPKVEDQSSTPRGAWQRALGSPILLEIIIFEDSSINRVHHQRHPRPGDSGPGPKKYCSSYQKIHSLPYFNLPWVLIPCSHRRTNFFILSSLGWVPPSQPFFCRSRSFHHPPKGLCRNHDRSGCGRKRQPRDEALDRKPFIGQQPGPGP